MVSSSGNVEKNLISAHRLDARFLENGAHLPGVLVVELGQSGGILVAVLELVVGEEFLPRGGLGEFEEHILPIGNVLRRDAGRRDYAADLRHRRYVVARLL